MTTKAPKSANPPLPKASDVAGFPVDADMQWSPSKNGKIIRVFYRYRGQDVPEPIATEMRKKLEQRRKEGKTGSFEIRRYIGEVHDNVFFPSVAFKAKPRLFPRPIKSMKGRRASKLDLAVASVFSSQYERLTKPDACRCP